MYHEHFRLSGEPFSLTPDPAFLFLSEKHREAMAAVQYGLLNGRGFITLIGEVGTGKTTILYSVLGQLGPEVATAYVPYAAHGFDDLLALALKDLGEQPPRGASRLELLEVLQRMLVRRDAAGQRTALVIDEAQSLADATFEELRLLSNFETYTHKLLQIVLVGQPELQERLRQQNLRQLQQRVSVRAIINPLDPAEMHAYIAHRLRQVGGSEGLFEPAALRTIVRHAHGIPRRANILCHNALLFAFGRSLPAVTAAAAAEAVAEMDERSPGLLRRDALRRLPRGWRWRRTLGMAAAAGLAVVVGGVVLMDGDRGAATAAGKAAAAFEPGEAIGETPGDAATTEVVAVADAPVPAAPPAAPPSPEPANAPVPEPAAAADGEERLAAAPPSPSGDGRGSEPSRSVDIPPGGTILGTARRLYGAIPNERGLLEEVRRLNPGLRDVNFVKAGAAVTFPARPGRTEDVAQDTAKDTAKDTE